MFGYHEIFHVLVIAAAAAHFAAVALYALPRLGAGDKRGHQLDRLLARKALLAHE